MSTPDTDPAGHPRAYAPAFADQARKIAALGATDIEIADILGIDVATLYRWKAQHRRFGAALKEGKQPADARVERSLYQRAVGYTYESVNIFNAGGKPLIVPVREHMPPDTTAALFWLKNRNPAQWRDKQPENPAGSAPTPIRVIERVIVKPPEREP